LLAVTILGNNSAIPAFDRHPTAQILQTEEAGYLIDCGEGTQLQMTLYKIRRVRLNHIFISHLHGDHYFGLIALLTSMGLLGRKQELFLYAPPELKTIIDLQLKVAEAHLPYTIHFYPLEDDGVIMEDKRLIVRCFKVKHRIPTWGFSFTEKKRVRRLDPEKISELMIPVEHFHALQQGQDIQLEDGRSIENASCTLPGIPPRTYAYCADTLYDETLADKIRDADMVYHEATYLHALHEKAYSRFHSTSKQAAMIAQQANAKKLLIGHFSSMYENLDDFLREAREIFPNTELALEGICYKI
jgi:ribonuclease Z